MKKGVISIGVVISIVLGIVALSLLILLAGSKSNAGKDFYCKNLQDFKNPIFFGDDDYCEKNLLVDTSSIPRKTIIIEEFRNQARNLVFQFSKTYVDDIFSLEFPRDAEIKEAKLAFVNANEEVIVNQFENGQRYQIMTFGFNGGTETIYLNISNNIELEEAKMTVEGYNLPGAVDLVFALDNILIITL